MRRWLGDDDDDVREMTGDITRPATQEKLLRADKGSKQHPSIVRKGRADSSAAAGPSRKGLMNLSVQAVGRRER